PDRHESGVEATRPRPGRSRPPARVLAGYALAIIGTTAIVLAAQPIRDAVDPVATGFGFLVLVVVCVGLGGLGPGVVASSLGFAVFGFYFLPPYETIAVEKAHDVFVLFVFLGLSVLISVLVATADARARAAEARAEELRRQQELSRILVEPQSGLHPYDGVLRVVVAMFGFLDGALYVQEGPDRGLVEHATVGTTTSSVPPTGGDGVERLPLNVGRRNLGLLVMRGIREPLSPAERRILEAFGNQLALLLERDRVVRASITATTTVDPV
ncbi:MAG: PAS domain-containing sensor histidine kinase, partial [Actinomycetota bacterium]|nr:PAS domain-containing sensor histidine kinase [Actinomycetota bacterium]